MRNRVKWGSMNVEYELVVFGGKEFIELRKRTVKSAGGAAQQFTIRIMPVLRIQRGARRMHEQAASMRC